MFITDSIQFSSLKQDADTDSSNSQHLLSDLQDQNRNNFIFLDNNATSSFDFNKRKRSLDNSSDDAKSSFSDLHSQDNFNQAKFGNLTKSYSSSNSKSPTGSLIEKRIGTLETMLKDTASSNVPKKERKRKKNDTDSNKNVALSSVMVSNMQLMPPPSTMVTSSGITTCSPTTSSSNSNVYGTYGFVDLDPSSPSIGSPALRPITLNVKPSAMSNLNTGNVSITGKFGFILL